MDYLCQMMNKNIDYLRWIDRLRPVALLLSAEGYKINKIIIDESGCKLRAIQLEGAVELDWADKNDKHKKINISAITIVVEI